MMRCSRGEGFFKNNRIYSTSPRMITSNQSLRLDGNQYVLYSHDGSMGGKWTYGDRMFHGFADYRTSSGQDAAGSFHGVAAKNVDAAFSPEAMAPRQNLDLTYRELLAKPLIGLEDRVRLPRQLGGNWTIFALLSGSLDASGLMNEKSRKQLTVVKSLTAQFHGNGLRTVIAMGAGSGGDPGRSSLANAISDLNLDGVSFVAAPDARANDIAEPLLLLLSPEGHVIRAWRGGAGAAELGVAVRQTLGSPAYSQIGESN